MRRSLRFLSEFLLIVILIIGYIYFIQSILVPNITFITPLIPSTGGINGQAIGIGAVVSIVQTRVYFFKLVRLPLRIGDVDFNDMHNLFFFLINCLILFFVALELINYWRGRNENKNAENRLAISNMEPI